MTINWIIGLCVAFAVGFGCRWFDVPAPAPPMWQGALLVVAMTLGYSAAGRVKAADVPPAITDSSGRRPG